MRLEDKQVRLRKLKSAIQDEGAAAWLMERAILAGRLLVLPTVQSRFSFDTKDD